MAHQGEWQEQPTPGPPGPHVSLYHNAAASHHRSGQGRQPSLDAVLKIARISCPVLWEQSTSHTQITRWQEPALQMGSVWLQCWTPSCFMTSDRVPTFLNWKASHLKKKKKVSGFSKKKKRERERKRYGWGPPAPSAAAACALQSPASRKSDTSHCQLPLICEPAHSSSMWPVSFTCATSSC